MSAPEPAPEPEPQEHGGEGSGEPQQQGSDEKTGNAEPAKPVPGDNGSRATALAEHWSKSEGCWRRSSAEGPLMGGVRPAQRLPRELEPRHYIGATVGTQLTAALKEVARLRPAQPYAFIADYLLEPEKTVRRAASAQKVQPRGTNVSMVAELAQYKAALSAALMELHYAQPADPLHFVSEAFRRQAQQPCPTDETADATAAKADGPAQGAAPGTSAELAQAAAPQPADSNAQTPADV